MNFEVGNVLKEDIPIRNIFGVVIVPTLASDARYQVHTKPNFITNAVEFDAGTRSIT